MSLTWLLQRFTLKSSKTRLKPVSLENIRVAAPCPASWEQMIGNDRIRHCAECNLNVYNLSEMTRWEAESLIASREGRLCVRFYRRADGTILTRNCPRGLQAMIRRVSRMAGAALSAAMSLGTAFAQTVKQAPPEQSQEQAAQQKAQLTVTVVDPTGTVVPNAKLQLTSNDTGITYADTTHSDGIGVLSGLAPGSFVLKVSRTGFKVYQRGITISQNKTEKVQIEIMVAETGGAIVETRPMR